MALSPAVVRRAEADPQEGRDGQGVINRDDPCTHLPTPPGKAIGIESRCRSHGSSSGIAKGDFNNDGYADLAIGEPDATIGGQAGAGDVYILYGSANGLTSSGKALFYEGRVPGTGSPAAGDGFGTALASGDFNGDGYSDLAIGIPGRTVTYSGNTYQTWGRVVIIFGSANGLTTSDSSVPAAQIIDFSLDPYDINLNMPTAGARLGQALAWGDFNGDGIGDLAIGAPNFTLNRLFAPSQAGAVWILYGARKTSNSATGGLKDGPKFEVSDLGGTLSPYDDPNPGDHFGSALAAGDFDGDGHADLAIGVPDKSYQNCFLFICTTVHTAGNVYVLAGSSSGITLAVSFAFGGPLGEEAAAGLEFGSALAAGDFNGDGKADLAVGAPESVIGSSGAIVNNGGSVTVFYGSATGLNKGPLPQLWNQQALGLTPDASEDQFGFALAAGDFNGDGEADLAVGVPGRIIHGLLDAGEVDVIYGSSTGLSLSHSPQHWNQANAFPAGGLAAGNRFGSALTAWNFGRNELTGFYPFLLLHKTADLAIGVPFQTVKNALGASISGAGAVNVMYGSYLSNGLTGLNASGQTTNQVITAESIGFGSQAGAHFGLALY